MAKALKIAGIRHYPKWDWSAVYKRDVAEHARFMQEQERSEHLKGNGKLTVVELNTGWKFRRSADQELAERMARYALWLYKRDNGTALNARFARVSLETGMVRFEIEHETVTKAKRYEWSTGRVSHTVKSTETFDVKVPNHNWQPVLIDCSAAESAAA